MRWGRKGQWVLFERFVIGTESDPYMIRWRLVECPWFRVFIHKIVRSDADRHLHDHPWNFISVILWGGYQEIRQRNDGQCPEIRLAGSIAFRRATDLHRIVTTYPTWTLILAGRRLRDWGFNTEEGWVPWREYQEAW